MPLFQDLRFTKEDRLIFKFCVIRLFMEPKNLLDSSKYDQRRHIGFDFTNCNVFLIATQTIFVWFLNDMQIKLKAQQTYLCVDFIEILL